MADVGVEGVHGVGDVGVEGVHIVTSVVWV